MNVALLSLSIVLLDPLYRAYAEQRYFLIRVRTLLVILEIFLLWIGTTHFGLVGAIAAVVAVNLTERIVTSIRFGRIVGVTREDLSALGDVGKIVLAGTGAALVSFLIRARILAAKPVTVILACSAVFALIYAIGILALKVPSGEEKRTVLDRIGQFQQRLFGSSFRDQ